MDATTIEAVVGLMEQDKTLEADGNLGRRLNVIDLLNYLSNHPPASYQDEAYQLADQRLGVLKDRLTAINTALYERLRTQIREKQLTPEQLRQEFNSFTDYQPQVPTPARAGTDDLDSLLDGILELQSYSYLTDPPQPNMVPYVPTPARVVLEAVDRLELKPDDLFYDFGSGLGRVVLLANLISGVRAKGIEISSVLNQHASEFADKLALSNVSFVNADVRETDYTDGSVFFMYTPFTGDILRGVLDQLHKQAQVRPLRICSYGPNTNSIAYEPWLQAATEDVYDMFRPVVFHSVQG